MIKTILVPATGSDTDPSVFAAALAVARPLGAHLGFLHTRLDAAAFATAIMPEVSSGHVVVDMISKYEEEAEQREQKARQLVEAFCQREGLIFVEPPSTHPDRSATWFREDGSESYWLAEYARTADLLVIGRPNADQRFPSDMLETALIYSGRPLFIPPSIPMSTLPDKVVIAWKPTREAARTVAAAMPLLSVAREIVIMTVAESETTMQEEGATRLMTNLCSDGFSTSVRRLEPGAEGPAEALLAAAREQGALLVMGGYGHSRVRQWIFGGFTQRVLREAEIPVLIAH
jgi:nucleotide-binding universal stress UspA family protein